MSFDIGYDQKVEETLFFTIFDYCNIFWLKVTNVHRRQKFSSLKSDEILAK